MKKKLITMMLIALGGLIQSNLFAKGISFQDIQQHVQKWEEEQMSPLAYAMQGTKHKVITYDSYTIDGYFKGGELRVGTTVSIYETPNAMPIITGFVESINEGLIIRGKYQETINNHVCYFYGTFQISNMQNGTMCFKPKKAENISIKKRDIDFYEGIIHEREIIISLESSKPYMAINSDSEQQFFKAPISREVIKTLDFKNLDPLILQTLKNVYYKYGGYTFEGDLDSVVIDDDKQIRWVLGTGKFTYPNGDYFNGNIQGTSLGNVFFDGYTVLADGTRLEGMWLEQFNLSTEQLFIATAAEYPSHVWNIAKKYEKQVKEAKRAAEKAQFDKFYIDYKCNDVGHYNIYVGDYIKTKTLFYAYGYIEFNYMTYDKRQDCYWLRNIATTEELFKTDNIKGAFAMDENGKFKWVITYKKDKMDKYVREYQIEYSYYTNGVIQQFKIFSCETKLLVLVCNFFSDGKLRSAYQYGVGNSGENIVRYSKEAHPTWGDYTSKLYDLDGNYERSIQWGIGEGIHKFDNQYFTAPELADFIIIDRFQ